MKGSEIMDLMRRSPEPVYLDYTNWLGIRRVRKVRPLYVTYASNNSYPQPQWFLVALDTELGENRLFAVKSIHDWRFACEFKAAEPGDERPAGSS